LGGKGTIGWTAGEQASHAGTAGGIVCCSLEGAGRLEGGELFRRFRGVPHSLQNLASSSLRDAHCEQYICNFPRIVKDEIEFRHSADVDKVHLTAVASKNTDFSCRVPR
jgi:hypothetical protein